MRLAIINEDSSGGNHSNSLAHKLSSEIENLGFRTPTINLADNESDDAILYVEAGRNIIDHESRIIMIRVFSDDNIQLQLPLQLSELLGTGDYFKTASAAETIARLTHIRSLIMKKMSSMGHRSDIVSGNIPENEHY
jgi:hypothetical protein